MKIFFGCTTSRWSEFRDDYLGIRNYLRELGCEIMFDWLDEADRSYKTNYKSRNIEKIFKNVINAIDNADAVVVEYTVPNFSSSHQINYALIKKKPVLIMRQFKDNPRFSNSYLEALSSNLITVRNYSKRDYKNTIKEFIGLTKIENGPKRYNIVLNKKEKMYLDFASVNYNKSRSEIIRDLINVKISNDSNYKKFLNLENE